MNVNPSPTTADELLIPMPSFVPRRYRPGSLGNWSGHLAFANDLIADLKPSLLVELGTHYGESYFGMCQSIQENQLNCVCYAVDHWLGEEHAGYYSEEVFTEVNEYNRRFYKDFSYLLRAPFDDVLMQFADETIDLLHIDGLHTYEAVLHDFRSWFPKVAVGGIILLHDIEVRHANFGIWKLWEELSREFSETFTFQHDWGLGVLKKPGKEDREGSFLARLFTAPDPLKERIRRQYVIYGGYVECMLRDEGRREACPEGASVSSDGAARPLHGNESNSVGPASAALDEPYFQIFLPRNETYSEESTLRQHLNSTEWQSLHFDIDFPIDGSIRIDPVNKMGLIQIGEIRIIDRKSGADIWSASTVGALMSLRLQHCYALPGDRDFLLLCWADDPQIYLPALTLPSSWKFEVSVWHDVDFRRLPQTLDSLAAKLAGQPAQPAYQAPSCSDQVRVQFYPAVSGSFSEDTAVTRNAEVGRWNTLTIPLPSGALLTPLRFDPADRVCVVEIADFQVIDSMTNETLYRMPAANDSTYALGPLDSAIRVPAGERDNTPLLWPRSEIAAHC